MSVENSLTKRISRMPTSTTKPKELNCYSILVERTFYRPGEDNSFVMMMNQAQFNYYVEELFWKKSLGLKLEKKIQQKESISSEEIEIIQATLDAKLKKILVVPTEYVGQRANEIRGSVPGYLIMGCPRVVVEYPERVLTHIEYVNRALTPDELQFIYFPFNPGCDGVRYPPKDKNGKILLQ